MSDDTAQLLKVLDTMHERRPVQSEPSLWGVAAEVVRTLDAELTATRDLIRWLIDEDLVDVWQVVGDVWAAAPSSNPLRRVEVPSHLVGAIYGALEVS